MCEDGCSGTLTKICAKEGITYSEVIENDQSKYETAKGVFGEDLRSETLRAISFVIENLSS